MLTLDEFKERLALAGDHIEEIKRNICATPLLIQKIEELNGFFITLSVDTDGYLEEFGADENTFYFDAEDNDTVIDTFLCGKAKTVVGLYRKYVQFYKEQIVEG